MTPLALIGRERALVNKLAKQLNDQGSRGHQVTPVRETARGAWFDVLMYDGRESTDRVARVTVEFDRIEQP